MGKIALEKMEFYAYHGYFDEEQTIGNKYEVDVIIETDLSEAALSDNLSDTINYGTVYQHIATVMQIKHRLLEHICHNIIKALRNDFSSIEKVSVSVSKFNPPLGGVCERSRITIEG